MLLSDAEDKIRKHDNGECFSEPHAVGDPVHVEKSFVRNLGGLIRSLLLRECS